MKFIPFKDKIVVEPIVEKGFLVTDTPPLEEMGTVIAIGKDVKFVKVGDILHFNSWGVQKTSEIAGVRYYVVPESSDFILGKENATNKKHVSRRVSTQVADN